jgi:ABC-2 type transport system permease protein
MDRILTLAQKDLIQMVRDLKTFLFLLIMPVAFTFLFGFAFGGFSQPKADSRPVLAVINQDGSDLSLKLQAMLAGSQVVKAGEETLQALPKLQKGLEKNNPAGILVIPQGYSQAMQAGELPRLDLYANPTQSEGAAIQGEVTALESRMASAALMATVAGSAAGADRGLALEQALTAWQEPPIRIETTTRTAATAEGQSPSPLANTSAGMMLQFGIAGLLTCAQVILNERKTRSLQRLLTTATRKVDILIGHFLAIFVLIFTQFGLLIAFGQWVLRVDYFHDPAATLLIAFTSTLCIAAIGLLIGALAKSDEQAILFALIPMFILSGLGGAWVPLDQTGKAFQAVGHLSPVAWALDGFKNVTMRGLGVEAALLPAAMLAGYALLFFALAAWRFQVSDQS